jgi:hypothetical protein
MTGDTPSTRAERVIRNAGAPPDATSALQLALTAVFELSDRVRALESAQSKSLADCYRGTFLAGSVYARGQLLTHKGSLWLAMSVTTSEPGSCSDWKLVVQRGRDAR